MGKNGTIPRWKRPFDIAFSFIAILTTFPLMFFVAMLIKFSDGGEILYKQKRPGLNGKSFTLYKFRTMYPANDKILREFLKRNPEAKNEWELYRKLKSYDPRVTPIGRFLRKYSLDELPQFFNVLKGDMSVVGPRPYLWEEFREYKIPERTIKKLLSVKPGLTGLWQVDKRNKATFQNRINIDLKYIDNMSLWIDLKIVLKTLWIILIGNGF